MFGGQTLPDGRRAPAWAHRAGNSTPLVGETRITYSVRFVATVADRILGHLTGAPTGLDDGRLAEAIGASRSSVNNACRKLAEQGRLVRIVGPDGKIVNQVAVGTAAPPNGQTAEAPAAEESVAAAPAAPAAADSDVDDAPQIPAARQGLDDVPGIPAARLPGDDEPAPPAPAAEEATPSTEPAAETVEPVAAEAEPEPAPEPEPTPEVAPVASAEPAASEEEPAAPVVEAAAAPEPASEPVDVAVPEDEVAEAELIAAPATSPDADTAATDDTAADDADGDIEDADTSTEPDPPTSTSGARRPWWRRLLPLR